MKFIASEIFWNDREFRAIYLFVYILFPCISRKKSGTFQKLQEKPQEERARNTENSASRCNFGVLGGNKIRGGGDRGTGWRMTLQNAMRVEKVSSVPPCSEEYLLQRDENRSNKGRWLNSFQKFAASRFYFPLGSTLNFQLSDGRVCLFSQLRGRGHV